MNALLLVLLFSKPVYASEPKISRPAVRQCLDDLRLAAWKRAGGPKEKRSFPFHSVAASELPMSCPSGDLEGVKRALRNQLRSCEKLNPGDTRVFACRAYTREEWCLDANRKLLAAAEGAKDFAGFLAKAKGELDWVKTDGWPDGSFKGEAQFTAYHAPPPIEASEKRTREFRYPLYRRPKDLVVLGENSKRSCGKDKITGTLRKTCRRLKGGKLAPFPDRNEIDNGGALKGKRLELAWARDPVEIAFLMVEGSGSLNLRKRDGTVKRMHVNFDGSNGRALNMLGRVLRCLNAGPESYGSMTGIKNFLAAHPRQRKTIMSFDQSYVFFKLDTGGPYGADGVAITPRHSFATDTSVIPTGAAMWFHTADPGATKDSACREITSFGLSQDTGGAIIGPHVDWYLGEGEDAQNQADAVNQAGSLFVGLPKGGGKAVTGCGAH